MGSGRGFDLRRVEQAHWIIISLVAALLLVGCRGAVLGLALTPEPSRTATESPWPSPTATGTPTQTPTPTATVTPTATATATPSPTMVPLQVEVALGQAQVVQGRTVVVRVVTNRPCRVSGTLGDRLLTFVSQGDYEHVALAGVSAIAVPGTSPVVIRVRAEDGGELTLATSLQIVTGEFGREILRFSPQVARLLDPKIIEEEQKRLAEIYATSASRIMWQGIFVWPCKGEITSEFGTRRGYEEREGSYHTGVDISGQVGDIVRASAAGIVVLAEPLPLRGSAVILDHGAGVFSSYCHLDRIEVQVGQAVQQGDVIGRLGATGLVTGAHLHWEVRVGGVAVDPKEWTTRQFP